MDKVGKPHISSYISHVAAHNSARKGKFAIIPDLHSHNFPAGKQTVNDSGVASTAEAFFEIKAHTVYKNRYAHNNNNANKPSDR